VGLTTWNQHANAMRATWRAPSGVLVLAAGLAVPIAALAAYVVPHTFISLLMARTSVGRSVGRSCRPRPPPLGGSIISHAALGA
jgi:hypothetical protein